MNLYLKSLLIFHILFLGSSISSFASEYSIIFRLGEAILNWSGSSYVEKQNEVELTKKELENLKLENETLKQQHKSCQLDYQGCTEREEFKVTPVSQNIQFSLLDILRLGCSGNLTSKKISTSNRNPEAQITEINENVYIVDDHKTYLLNFHLEKKTLVRPTKRFHHKDEIRLFPFDSPKAFHSPSDPNFPSIILGKIYFFDRSSGEGTRNQVIKKIKYTVIENQNKKLEVTMTGEITTTPNSGTAGLKHNYQFTCVGKSLAELNDFSEKEGAHLSTEELRELIFGKQ